MNMEETGINRQGQMLGKSFDYLSCEYRPTSHAAIQPSSDVMGGRGGRLPVRDKLAHLAVGDWSVGMSQSSMPAVPHVPFPRCRIRTAHPYLQLRHIQHGSC